MIFKNIFAKNCEKWRFNSKQRQFKILIIFEKKPILSPKIGKKRGKE
jgi:hypothetical protein